MYSDLTRCLCVCTYVCVFSTLNFINVSRRRRKFLSLTDNDAWIPQDALDLQILLAGKKEGHFIRFLSFSLALIFFTLFIVFLCLDDRHYYRIFFSFFFNNRINYYYFRFHRHYFQHCSKRNRINLYKKLVSPSKQMSLVFCIYLSSILLHKIKSKSTCLENASETHQ